MFLSNVHNISRSLTYFAYLFVLECTCFYTAEGGHEYMNIHEQRNK